MRLRLTMTVERSEASHELPDVLKRWRVACEEPMKRAFQFVILTVLAAEALVLGQGPTSMKVLADVRAALGGDDKLDAVKSVAVEGRLTRSVGGQSLANDFEMSIELPDKFVKKEVVAAWARRPSRARPDSTATD